ncbi:MAG: transposase [Candidatus Rokubacteria bacterium]|nr:transposase [Candidatus Rokubacteria bacterium]
MLHTWGQALTQHVHVHCVVTGGALAPDGARWIPARPGFLFPSAPWRRSSAAGISPGCRGPSTGVSCISPGGWPPWRRPRPLPRGSMRYAPRPGSSTASRPLLALNTCWRISAAIPTAARSPTTACLPSPTAMSASAGATTPMALASRSWTSRPTSSSAASCSTWSPTASSASATAACSPIADERQRSPSAASS